MFNIHTNPSGSYQDKDLCSTTERNDLLVWLEMTYSYCLQGCSTFHWEYGPMTQDRHKCDYSNHYVSPWPRLEPRLTPGQHSQWYTCICFTQSNKTLAVIHNHVHYCKMITIWWRFTLANLTRIWKLLNEIVANTFSLNKIHREHPQTQLI